MPSAEPSRSCFYDEFEGDTWNVLTGLEYTFITPVNNSNYYLTVEVISNDYSSSAEYAVIYLNNALYDICDPGYDGGSSFENCFYRQRITSYLDADGNLKVTVVATELVSQLKVKVTLSNDNFREPQPCEFAENPSAAPSSPPSHQPSAIPTSEPSFTQSPSSPTGMPSSSPSSPTYNPSSSSPTSLPSAVPTSPTSEPSAVPSISVMPTQTYCETWEGGTNDPSGDGIQHMFTDETIAPMRSYGQLHLSVDAYVTDFSDSLEYISLIAANRQSISTFCDPDMECGETFYRCVDNLDVSGDEYFKNDEDNSLFVTIQATECVNICPYRGYVLYVKLFLCSVPATLYPSESPSSAPTTTPTLAQQTSALLPGEMLLDNIGYTEFLSDEAYIDAIEFAIRQSTANFSNIADGYTWIETNVTFVIREDGASVRRVLCR